MPSIRRIRVELVTPLSLTVFGRGSSVSEAAESAAEVWSRDAGEDTIPVSVSIVLETGKRSGAVVRWDLSETIGQWRIPDDMAEIMIKARDAANESLDEDCRQLVRAVIDIEAIVDWALGKAMDPRL